MVQKTLDIQQKIHSALAQNMGDATRIATHIAVGVSGGGDSMALLLALHQYIDKANLSVELVALTVDHNLREAAADEAKQVGKWCAKLGIEHHILNWQFAVAPTSGVQEKARKARYQLLGEYCVAHDISSLYMAHNLEDNAETFIMRLQRGAALRGLASIVGHSIRQIGGVSLNIVRPLLGIKRAELRDYLRHCEQQWFDDVSNLDEKFERVRVRKFLSDSQLLSSDGIAQSATRLARADEALEFYVENFWQNHIALLDLGIAKIEFEEFMALPSEIKLRLLARLVWSLGGQSEPPRWQKIEHLLAELQNQQGVGQHCLAHCFIVRKKAHLWFGYEGRQKIILSKISLAPQQKTLWQNRFEITNGTNNRLKICNLAQMDEYLKPLVAQHEQLKDCPKILLKYIPILLSEDGLMLQLEPQAMVDINFKLKIQR